MKRKHIFSMLEQGNSIYPLQGRSGEANFGGCSTDEMLRPSFLIPAGTCKSSLMIKVRITPNMIFGMWNICGSYEKKCNVPLL